MIEQTVTLDKRGRIALPSDVQQALGVGPEDKLTLRIIDKKLVLEAMPEVGPLTRRIAAMNLPVSDWELMEHQIEQGRTV